MKFVDPMAQISGYGTGILLNETTVLTLSQYAFNKSTSTYLTSIQFYSGENATQTYRVTEAFILKDKAYSNMKSEVVEYAVLKL